MRGLLLVLLLCCGQLLVAAPKSLTIAVVAPVDIPAMTQIINGFKTQLHRQYHGKFVIDVANAQGDINIMRSIFQQLKARNVDVVVPIGTQAAQMADKINTTQPIVALAANFNNQTRSQFLNNNITNVLDEIDPAKQIAFMHTAFPKLQHISLVYSPSDKIVKQVSQAEQAAKHYGVSIQKLMIQNLPDLYAVSRQISSDAQALYVLKDETIVSGINTLILTATKKHLPLVASDDGSVNAGAQFAVGVSEAMIGEQGATLVAEVLTGKQPKSIPVKVMTHYHVFVNPKFVGKSFGSVSYADVVAAAKQFNYPVTVLK
jgi:putative ABC transport system substrate-binding protein